MKPDDCLKITVTVLHLIDSWQDCSFFDFFDPRRRLWSISVFTYQFSNLLPFYKFQTRPILHFIDAYFCNNHSLTLPIMFLLQLFFKDWTSTFRSYCLLRRPVCSFFENFLPFPLLATWDYERVHESMCEECISLSFTFTPRCFNTFYYYQ